LRITTLSKKPIKKKAAPKKKVVAKKPVKKAVAVKAKSPAKKVAKKPAKKVVKKPVGKKVAKKKPVVKKIAAKKLAAKKPIKKAIKKLAPKKAVKKLAAKKPAKKSAKKSAKKLVVKKIVKKAIAKKPVAKKKVAAKKPAARKTLTAKIIIAPKGPRYTGPDWPLMNVILDAMDDAKAEEVLAINVEGRSSMADGMVIASGRANRHVAAIADQLVDKLKAFGQKDVRVEGLETSDWVLVDAGNVIVHIFRPEVRSFYNLEKLWSEHAPLESRDAE
jgi:ribosome-associated protein